MHVDDHKHPCEYVLVDHRGLLVTEVAQEKAGIGHDEQFIYIRKVLGP